jgi:hypothetical protein
VASYDVVVKALIDNMVRRGPDVKSLLRQAVKRVAQYSIAEGDDSWCCWRGRVPAEVEALIEDKKTRLSSADRCTTLPSHSSVQNRSFNKTIQLGVVALADRGAMNELQSEASQALSAVLGGFELEDNFNTLAPTIRAMLDHERWQIRLVELLLSLRLSGITLRLLRWPDLADP